MACFQVLSDFGSDLLRKDIKIRLFVCDKQVAYKYRIAMYVGTSQVQGPGYFIQCGDENGLCVVLVQTVTDLFQLVVA